MDVSRNQYSWYLICSAWSGHIMWHSHMWHHKSDSGIIIEVIYFLSLHGRRFMTACWHCVCWPMMQTKKKPLLNFWSYMWLNTSKGTSCLGRSKLTFYYFLNSCSFSSIMVQKILKLDIMFLRYGNFIEGIITDWWKVNFDKKALIIWESVQSIDILVILSIEDSKKWKISKSTLRLYFEIFWLCIHITQNPVSRKLYLSLCWVTYYLYM